MGSSENATVPKQLLSNLVARGLDLGQGVLCAIDGAKPLRKASDQVLGPVPVQRCIRHKERNVLDHLPERARPESANHRAGRARRLIFGVVGRRAADRAPGPRYR